jgi:ABC-type transporter Mla subunit MlaD
VTLFSVRVDHYHHAGTPAQPDPLLGQILASINLFGDSFMTTQAELAADLQALAAQTNKAKAEIVAKLDDLAQALANAGNASPEVLSAFDALKGAVQGVDDIVPDVPSEPSPEA